MSEDIYTQIMLVIMGVWTGYIFSGTIYYSSVEYITSKKVNWSVYKIFGDDVVYRLDVMCLIWMLGLFSLMFWIITLPICLWYCVIYWLKLRYESKHNKLKPIKRTW